MQRIAAGLDNRFDVDNRGGVDRFQAFDLQQTRRIHAQNFGAVQSDWVRAVGRTSRKYAGERILQIASRVNLKDRAVRFMKPRQNPNVLADFDAIQTTDKRGKDVECCVGRTLRSLTGSGRAVLSGERT